LLGLAVPARRGFVSQRVVVLLNPSQRIPDYISTFPCFQWPDVRIIWTDHLEFRYFEIIEFTDRKSL